MKDSLKTDLLSDKGSFRQSSQSLIGARFLLFAVFAALLMTTAITSINSTVSAVSQNRASAGPGSWAGDFSPIGKADWSYDRAAHLLERAGFGGTPEEIEELAKMTPQQTVRHLVYFQQVKNVEILPFDHSGVFPSGDFIPPTQGEHIRQATMTGEALGIKVERKPGAMWLQPVVNAGYYYRFANNGEIARVSRWFAQRMLVTKRPLEEKLALFWHGHFATENDKVRDYRKMMAQWELYRQYGAGNFRDLLLGVCKDPAMLIYLDGRTNVKGQPNENFAREILELFSLGVDNYTQQDIREAARAFTGWGLDGNKFTKRADLHDEGSKTIFGKTGAFDGEQVVELILQQKSSAQFIARKLYRFFVREEIAPAVEEKLAAKLRESKFEIAPLLETIFLSRDFYSPASVATQIKSPTHLVVSTYKKLGLTEIPGAPNFTAMTREMGQQLCSPPNVAGWKGGRTWINPATVIQRQNFIRYVLFPREIPPPTRNRMDFVADIIGQQAYQQLNEMAKRGDFTNSPSMAMEDSGFNRSRSATSETYNVFRGVYNGAIRTHQVLKVDSYTPAKVDLVGAIRQAGAKDAPGVIDHFARRFLRAPLEEADRQEAINYLKGRIGGAAIDFNRANLENDLREVLHLMLSLPAYQLA